MTGDYPLESCGETYAHESHVWDVYGETGWEHRCPGVGSIAELTEMLTAATDTAVQRGKRIDAIRELCTTAAGEGNHLDGVSIVKVPRIRKVLDSADGG